MICFKKRHIFILGLLIVIIFITLITLNNLLNKNSYKSSAFFNASKVKKVKKQSASPTPTVKQNKFSCNYDHEEIKININYLNPFTIDELSRPYAIKYLSSMGNGYDVCLDVWTKTNYFVELYPYAFENVRCDGGLPKIDLENIDASRINEKDLVSYCLDKDKKKHNLSGKVSFSQIDAKVTKTWKDNKDKMNIKEIKVDPWIISNLKSSLTNSVDNETIKNIEKCFINLPDNAMITLKTNGGVSTIYSNTIDGEIKDCTVNSHNNKQSYYFLAGDVVSVDFTEAEELPILDFTISRDREANLTFITPIP